MRVLVLWADDTSPNLGVRALAEGTAALVRSVWPDAVVEFQNYGSRTARARVGSPRVLLDDWVTRRHGVRAWARSFDLVVDTRSGDSFADIYGLDRLVAMSALGEFVHRAGVPLVLGPQTIGPFTTRRGELIARRSMRTAAQVMARDGSSAICAEELGRRVDVRTTDVVFALPTPARTGGRDVVLNVSGLLWNGSPHVDPRAYRSVVRDLFAGLQARDRTVTLLAHVLDGPSPDNDVATVQEFAAEVGGGVEVVVPGSLAEVRDVVASADLVLGSRMHACLNALSVGTPAIPLSYSRKFEPLLADLGWTAQVDLRSAAAPAQDALALVDRAPALAPQVSELRSRAAAMLEPAAAALRALR
jgi:colanic acid/amylovoran biosynthesis protein